MKKTHRVTLDYPDGQEPMVPLGTFRTKRAGLPPPLQLPVREAVPTGSIERIFPVPIDAIVCTKLIRDRTPGLDPEIYELKASIRAVGLSNPIRVEVGADDTYQLIQGWRRLTVFRELHAESGGTAYATIPAALVAPGLPLPALYRRMVDENLIRREVSFAEMAILARAYSDDPATPDVDLRGAVEALFVSAGRQKRLYVRRFAELLARLGEVLNHPAAIPRQLGLDLVRRMTEDRTLAARLMDALGAHPDRDAALEVTLLRRGLNAKNLPPRKRKPDLLRLRRKGATASAHLSDGRLELRAPLDFTAIPKRTLRAALAQLFDTLDPGGA